VFDWFIQCLIVYPLLSVLSSYMKEDRYVHYIYSAWDLSLLKLG